MRKSSCAVDIVSPPRLWKSDAINAVLSRISQTKTCSKADVRTSAKTPSVSAGQWRRQRAREWRGVARDVSRHQIAISRSARNCPTLSSMPSRPSPADPKGMPPTVPERPSSKAASPRVLDIPCAEEDPAELRSPRPLLWSPAASALLPSPDPPSPPQRLACHDFGVRSCCGGSGSETSSAFRPPVWLPMPVVLAFLPFLSESPFVAHGRHTLDALRCSACTGRATARTADAVRSSMALEVARTSDGGRPDIDMLFSRLEVLLSPSFAPPPFALPPPPPPPPLFSPPRLPLPRFSLPLRSPSFPVDFDSSAPAPALAAGPEPPP